MRSPVSGMFSNMIYKLYYYYLYNNDLSVSVLVVEDQIMYKAK